MVLVHIHPWYGNLIELEVWKISPYSIRLEEFCFERLMQNQVPVESTTEKETVRRSVKQTCYQPP